jgi:hypothetical protein
MTDHEVEDFVRDTFRDHEHLVGDAATRLLPSVRTRRQRRTTTRSAAVALAAVAVIGGTVVAANALSTPGRTPEPSASATQGTVPAGWRVESAAGIEVAVPADWAVNDYGCGQTNRPSYVLNGGSYWACFTPEPSDKQIAQIMTPVTTVDDVKGAGLGGLAERQVFVNGVAATRAEGRITDGRFAGWLFLGPRRGAVVTKTLDPTVTRQILDSVRLVDGVDSVGCATRAPAAARPPVVPLTTASPAFVGPEPTAISICHYGMREPEGTPQQTMLLDWSTRITGDDAHTLAALLNAAPPGTNRDGPAHECRETNLLPLRPDIVLRLWNGDKVIDTVWVTYSSCTGRGLDNGTRHAQVSHTLLRIMHAGYTLQADIPR